MAEVIWHGGQNPAVVYVGQGEIAARLAEHRENQDILIYKEHGLFATWADVTVRDRDGIERFLADKYQPRIGDRHPISQPIEVNSPWDQ